MFVYHIHFTVGSLRVKLSGPDLNLLLVLHQYNFVKHNGIAPDFACWCKENLDHGALAVNFEIKSKLS